MDVVVIADPFTSKLITSSALVDRLRAEGHRARLRVPPGRVDRRALAALDLTVDLEDLRVEPPGRLGPSPEAVARYQAQLADDDADLYLIDTEAHEYILAAVAGGLPVALLSVLFNLWKRPGVPPVHQDVVPGRGLRGSRLGIEYGWAGFRTSRLPQIAASMLRRNDRRHHLLSLARELGLAPRQLLTEFHGLIPFQYRTMPTLTLNLPELELPGAEHPLNRYVGPMPNLAGMAMAGTEPDAVLAEVDALRAEHPDRKLIYGAFGAYYDGDDLGFWRRAIEAVGQRHDWIGVFGLGDRIDADDLAPLPGNVRVLSWAPQLAVLERADCAMIHAGMTSMYECLHHRVPMVMFPLGDSFDQFGTAARATHYRLAPVGDRSSVTTSEIQDLVDRAMTEPGYRERLRSFGAAMDRHRETRALTTTIEAMVAEVGYGQGNH